MAALEELNSLLDRWYDQGDELAAARVSRLLTTNFYVPSEALRALGAGAVDEIRQDVLELLLDRNAQVLRTAASPVAYARQVLRNRLTSDLRKWGPRSKREGEVAFHVEQLAPDPLSVRVQTDLDAESALAIAENLGGKGRLAILLTTRPDRIRAEDWAPLVALLPPPPPPVPESPIDREEASKLLFPPQLNETLQQAEMRRNNFDRTWSRAVKRIRELWRLP
jgi:hypothetical protein